MKRRFRGADGWALGALVVLLAFAAGVLTSTRLQGPAPSNLTASPAGSNLTAGPGPSNTTATPAAAEVTLAVHMTMAGFEPAALTVRANDVVRLELTSMDNPLHADGGGWHEFAIDALGIDLKVGPLDSGTLEFTAPSEARTYRVYCDTCCGGKANPTMLGTLTVAASHEAHRAAESFVPAMPERGGATAVVASWTPAGPRHV